MILISLTALLKDGSIGIASELERNVGPFRCTFCKHDMIIHKGFVKIHHFAHYPDDTCPYATGESVEHEMAKWNLYNMARLKGIEADMEVTLSPHIRADITLKLDNGRVAIEFQKSGMTAEQAYDRMAYYGETGVPVIWVMLKGYITGGEHTITTKDKIFYDLYGNDLYTLYKDDLIDVWGWSHVWRNRDSDFGFSSHRLVTVRDWVRISRISLLDSGSFTVIKKRLHKYGPYANLLVSKVTCSDLHPAGIKQVKFARYLLYNYGPKIYSQEKMKKLWNVLNVNKPPARGEVVEIIDDLQMSKQKGE